MYVYDAADDIPLMKNASPGLRIIRHCSHMLCSVFGPNVNVSGRRGVGVVL